MATLLDYSAGKIPGSAIKAAGHAGAVRYITDRKSLGTKHTSPSEYADHVANGLIDWLVYEVNTNDPLGGWAGGVAAAQRALDGANFIGYPGRHIFFCFDRHATAAELPAWQAYLDGAASVIGAGRTGAYGFSEAIDAARGHASAFWQCGSRSAVRAFTNLYQRNTGATVVGGVTCDINDVLVPLQEAPDMDQNQAMQLDYLFKVFQRYPAGAPNGAIVGGVWTGDGAEFARKVDASVSVLSAKVDGLTAAVAALSSNPNLDAATVRQIVTDAVKQSIHITGTVAITGATA